MAIIARIVYEWSLVHGFAMLLIDGRLDNLLGHRADAQDVMALLDAAMQSSDTIVE